MLAAHVDLVLNRLRENDLLLDIGGWANPFPRADWVIDLMPYETRGLYQRMGWSGVLGGERAGPQRFGPETWIQRDVCDREPLPFENGQFDFATCSHTLEDVRDPVWVCTELMRVARAGYIEVPSRLEEQSYGVEGPFVGRRHHRWLIDVTESGISFVFKQFGIEERGAHFFPAGFVDTLSEAERVQSLWWEGRFSCCERIFTEPLDDYLAEFVKAHAGRVASSGLGRRRWRGLATRR